MEINFTTRLLWLGVLCAVVVESVKFRRKTMVGRGNPIPRTENQYNYRTYFYKQKVDHFGFSNSDTYMQRYLINKDYWSAGNPIFFYTGNEGDITWFCNNTGFMWDIAPRFGAMLVFGEHRYYGKSLPYGNYSFKSPKYTNYLTSEQALADYVELITYIKATYPGASRSKVVAFGGSYGGMLSAWIRLKYPNVFAGSIAASAPIWMFPGMYPCEVFNQKTTHTFTLASSNCVENIRRTWKTIDTIASTAAGMTFLDDTFHLCNHLTSQDDVDDFKGWLADIYVNLAMIDYPYPTNFLEPVPGWPVKEVCKPLSDSLYKGKALMARLYTGVNVYFNYTGHAKCLNVSHDSSMSGDEAAWGYQTCTEMMTPMCSDGVHDMFEPDRWDPTGFSDDCFHDWGVRPLPHWSEREYWGRHLQAASNIVFSNGLLDPWSSLGVNMSYSLTVVSLTIAEGAHHLDLRASNKLDPISVIGAREMETKAIQRWILED